MYLSHDEFDLITNCLGIGQFFTYSAFCGIGENATRLSYSNSSAWASVRSKTQRAVGPSHSTLTGAPSSALTES